MSGLADLKELAENAPPGPWEWEYGVSRRTAWGLLGPGGRYVLRFSGIQDIAVVADPEPAMEFIEAASPDVVRALVAVAEALLGPHPNSDGCACDRDDESEAITLCPFHEERLRHLRWDTLATLVIDYEAVLDHVKPALDALKAVLA